MKTLEKEQTEVVKELLTRADALKFLQISVGTLNTWTKQGILTIYALGGRRYYKRSEIIKALKPF